MRVQWGYGVEGASSKMSGSRMSSRVSGVNLGQWGQRACRDIVTL